jgi:hypothetical protein
MKPSCEILLAAILVAASSAPAAPPTWEELSARLFTNTAIVWQAPTNKLPKRFWIYQRELPHVFSATVISNAVVLGSLQNKGFPKPSTNDFFIPEDKGPDYPGTLATIFGIRPGDANLYYSLPNYSTGSGDQLPNDETILMRARKCASQLGLDPAQMVLERIYTHSCDTGQNGQAANHVCGRGVFLSRQLDGIAFFSADNEGTGAEGFSIEFGSDGQIRFFSFRWSTVGRYESRQTASTQEITHCIRAHKTIVLPNPDEEDYFARLKRLAGAKKLTITKITPYYGEGVFGEVPTNDVPCKFATPFAELEAVADFGNSNTTIRLLSPILSSEVIRLLKSKTQ